MQTLRRRKALLRTARRRKAGTYLGPYRREPRSRRVSAQVARYDPVAEHHALPTGPTQGRAALLVPMNASICVRSSAGWNREFLIRWS
jgi:hypothetical protein